MDLIADIEILFFIVFLLYIAIGYVLLKSPFFWFHYPTLTFRAQSIGHRAGAGEALENTLSAVLKCVYNGVDMVELDCRMTSDGKVVCSHDDNLQRVAGVNVYISKTPYNTLPLLKKRITSEMNQAVVSPINEVEEERRIPLLESVLQSVRYLPINIDIKQNDPELIKKVNEMIVEYDREQNTVWGNADESMNNHLYQVNPNIPIFFSFRRVIKLLFLFYTGLLPYVPLRERFLEIPMLSTLADYGTVKKKFGSSLKSVLRIGDWFLMSPMLFDHLNRRKIQVFMWVLNTEDDFKRAFDYGASAIITDYPSKLVEYLKKNEPPEPVNFPRLNAVAQQLDKAREEIGQFVKSA